MVYKDDWKGWAIKDNICNEEVLKNDAREYDLDELRTAYPYDGDRLWKHGTFIAGIIGAKTNNGTDIAGIAGGWGNRGVSLLYLNAGVYDDFFITTENIKNAIEYCVLHDENTNNVDVVQMAFESAYSYSIEEDIDEAYIFNDIFFVAAAGNGG